MKCALVFWVLFVGVVWGEDKKISSKFSSPYESDQFIPSQSANPQHNYYQQQQQQQQIPRQQIPQSRPQVQQQYKPQQQQSHGQQGPPRRPQNNQKELTSSEELELQEEEEAKPDRLQLLLQESKFQCQGKKDGYYADEGLACEVFHYCQDGAKHSWLCPNGFAFHQIHLICVPPTSDNICQKSADYHFVNDYLYKPINQKQADVYNETLRYADRFFPEGYGGSELSINSPYYDEESEEEEKPVKSYPNRFQSQNNNLNNPPHFQERGRPVQQQIQQQYPRPVVQQVQQRPIQQQQQQQYKVQSQRPSPQGNYFTTPDQINIPLSQRRPVPSNLFKN